jgi:hypothetical protein
LFVLWIRIESREHPPNPGSILRIQNAAPAPNRCFKDLEERGETQEGREGGKRGSCKKVREGRKGRRKEEERRSEEKVREELWEERRKWWRSVVAARGDCRGGPQSLRVLPQS